MFEVLVRGLGANVDEATVKKWFAEEGDTVKEGEDLVELATENSTVVISVPATGVLAEVCFHEGDLVQRDEVICLIDEEDEELDEDEDADERDER